MILKMEIVEMWKSSMKHKHYKHIRDIMIRWEAENKLRFHHGFSPLVKGKFQDILSESDSKTVVSVQGHGPASERT